MARILVVNDSPTETHQFVNALARHGHQVLTAASGSDGIGRTARCDPDGRGYAWDQRLSGHPAIYEE